MQEKLDEREVKKRKLSTTGFTFALSLHDTNNQQTVQILLEDNVIKREVDDVLTCARREAVTALKWLQLHYHTRYISLKPWQNHYLELRGTRSEDETIAKVKETVYYPLLLPFLQAATLGQDAVQFFRQNYSKPSPREDCVGMVFQVPECLQRLS